MDTQRELFEIIRKQLPEKQNLADVIGDTLGLGSDSVYRRIRGDKELTLTEFKKICFRFNISIDSVLENQNNNLMFRYNPLEMNNLKNYRDYIGQFCRTLSELSNSFNKHIYFSANDIPIFHFLPYHELTFFKVYVWFKAMSDVDITFNQFVDQIQDKEELFDNYKNMTSSYLNIPSTEIWSLETIDLIISLIYYYFDLGAFNSNTAEILCGQLDELICKIEKWSEIGKKDNNTDYNLYLSATIPENSFMIIKKENIKSTTIKLFTINSILTTNNSICEETERWMNNLIAKSIPLSGVSARERFNFFLNMKDKINNLKDKINS
jgi:hypothetical protein